MFNKLCSIPSDINEHLPTLADLAGDCESITEMGVRYCVSTWAFVEGNPRKLTCIDIEHPSSFVHQGGEESFEGIKQECKDKSIDFRFIQASTLKIEIEPTDLLFIDTLHTGEQLKQELELHGDKALKYLALHDTVSCETELIPVIDEFLAKGKWKIKEHYKNNNGLMVLMRC